MPRSAAFVFLLATGTALFDAGAARSEEPQPTASDLAPTSAPPWSPPEPVPGERAWETIVRAPGRLLSLPLVATGFGIKVGLEFVEADAVIPRVLARFVEVQRLGIIVSPASLGDRTGFGAEIGYSPRFFGILSATLSGSTRGYNRGRVALTAPLGLLEYQNDWRPRDQFFGVGRYSRHDDQSNFAVKSQHARVLLRFPPPPGPPAKGELLNDAAASPETPTTRHPELRAWVGSQDVIVRDGREDTDDDPPITERFPSLASAVLDTRVEHLTYGASAGLDRRSGRPHWWRGWRASTKVERFAKPVEALAFHSASTPSDEFTRVTYEGELGLSFWRDPHTFRFYGRLVDQLGVGNEGVFLLPDLSLLGGREGLSGFEPGRFRDVDLIVGKVSYIFPIARYFELDLHAEAGNVYPRIKDIRVKSFEQSYGTALRVRRPTSVMASIGADWSSETVRIRFSLGGVE